MISIIPTSRNVKPSHHLFFQEVVRVVHSRLLVENSISKYINDIHGYGNIR